MKKAYKVSVDCANCANKIEVAVNNIEGIKSAVLNFMTQKLIVDFEDNANKDAVMSEIKKKAKKIERDFEIEA